MSNPTSSQLSPGLRNRRTLALFILLLALLMADNNLMAPNLTAIGAEFGFSRAEIDRRLGGDISLMFWLLGAVVTLAAGYFTDRTDLIRGLSRKRLLLLLVVIGQGACLTSGLSSTYRQLYWARTLTAVGMGAAGPVLGSLLADYVPPLHRPRALGYLNVACSFGIGGGQLLAGLLGPSLGWRIPFLCVGVMGLLVSVLYALWGDEPARGQHEPGLQAMRDAGLSYGERFRLRNLAVLLRGRTNAVMLATSLLGTVPYSVVMIFLNDYLAQDRGLGVPLATTVMLVIGFGGMVGNLASGVIAEQTPHLFRYARPVIICI